MTIKDEYQYVVVMKKGKDRWYLHDYDDTDNTGRWTMRLKVAYKFSDEEEIVDFCETFLRGRDYNIQAVK